MTIAVLSRYGRIGASSRLRMAQFTPHLRAAGLSPVAAPFFEDRYLARLYAGQPSRRAVLRAYLRRLSQLRGLERARLVWIEKEALPWLPWAVERRLLPRHVPLVSDYDDALFHRYDRHGSAAVRRLFGTKIDRLMAASALVTAGNGYLAERARRAGAPWIEIVPTVVDTTAYAPRAEEGAGEGRIGWIGTPSTWRAYMAPMMPLLGAVARAEGARIVAVGAEPAARPSDRLETEAWSEETEVARIQAMDIGIMPLTDTPWARGKCGYKLIQYMACGLPVVASPVGVNAEIVEHGVNGFLASSEAEWRAALGTLLRDPGLRRRMGAAGRRKVEAQYSLQVWGPRVAALLRDVAEGRRGG